MSVTNLDRARQGVIDSALIWKMTLRKGAVGRVAGEMTLLSALEDLEHVERTGEFPPGKWETYGIEAKP